MIKNQTIKGIMMACFVCLATVLICIVGGQSHSAQADDTPTEITTKVYVVDTKGNQLKAPEQFTIAVANPKANCVNVSVPGYDPAKTLHSVKFITDPAFQAYTNTSSKTFC